MSHPDHPSLLSISDTLEKYQIENLAVNIDADKLSKMPMPCIVQVEVNRQSLFFVLKNIEENRVLYTDDTNKEVITSKEDFLKQWTGVCLLAETTEESREVDIEKKLESKRITNVLGVGIGVLLVSWIIINFLNSEAIANVTTTINIGVYLILKFVGLSVGLMLLWYEVDEYNPTLQSFCSGSNKINCNAVLKSKQAKLFNGVLSLSLLGFSYFLGSLGYLLINAFSLSSLSVLGILSFTTLPIIFISIYYQALAIKQWCKFCIIIQTVLIAEIVVVFFGEYYKTSIELETIPVLLALLLIPILGWKLLKPLLKQGKETNLYKRGLKKIKNNPDVLEGLLLKSRRIKTPTQDLGISMNNESAKYDIIKVCNPYCGPCARAHPILDDLVDQGKINLQILFTASSSEDRIGKPVSHFLAIDAKGDKNRTQKALDDWYLTDNKNYEIFSSKYPMNGELNMQSNKIEAMRSWCETENITHTPTIFINGYELPKEYSIEDLKEALL
ncbi:hypothetical protein BFR04_06805 [Gaetbulibacter sp. 4G1]|nr:hypothetical protein BFR04_06805 [Gaetbulibacter sp. 4G1]